jgi:hypothetical protein
MWVVIKSRMAGGNQSVAQASFDEFVAWMHRPDRKDFDTTG